MHQNLAFGAYVLLMHCSEVDFGNRPVGEIAWSENWLGNIDQNVQRTSIMFSGFTIGLFIQHYYGRYLRNWRMIRMWRRGASSSNFTTIHSTVIRCQTYRPTGAFSKSRPILPCRISACNDTTFAMLVGDLFRSLRHPRSGAMALAFVSVLTFFVIYWCFFKLSQNGFQAVKPRFFTVLELSGGFWNQFASIFHRFWVFKHVPLFFVRKRLIWEVCCLYFR